MANEYQMRLKDMHAAEKIKEVTDKLTHEIEALKQQFEALRIEKVCACVWYRCRLQAVRSWCCSHTHTHTHSLSLSLSLLLLSFFT